MTAATIETAFYSNPVYFKQLRFSVYSYCGRCIQFELILYKFIQVIQNKYNDTLTLWLGVEQMGQGLGSLSACLMQKFYSRSLLNLLKRYFSADIVVNNVRFASIPLKINFKKAYN